MPNKKSFKNHKEYLKYYRDYRRKNREKLRKYNREYNREWRYLNGYHNEIKWGEENPKKIKAARLLQYAVRVGLIKKEPCEKCGDIKSQGHHDDYDKPLKVKWLCALCHKHYHLKKINRELSP